jgi:mercuric reductase
MATLAHRDLVVLNGPVVRDEKTRQITSRNLEIVGAYPMTTERTPHRVTANGIAVNAMCAVDALAISPLFGGETLIESRCHATGVPILIRQRGMQIVDVAPSSDVRVGIRWQSFSANAAHTLCTEMVFLKDAETAARWRSSDPSSIDLFTLAEAIELGSAFFQPLLEE